MLTLFTRRASTKGTCGEFRLDRGQRPRRFFAPHFGRTLVRVYSIQAPPRYTCRYGYCDAWLYPGPGEASHAAARIPHIGANSNFDPSTFLRIIEPAGGSRVIGHTYIYIIRLEVILSRPRGTNLHDAVPCR